jgi:hypothetical protein
LDLWPRFAANPTAPLQNASIAYNRERSVTKITPLAMVGVL